MAFQRNEDTFDAYLGAVMMAEYQATMIKFFEAYCTVHKKR